MNPADTDTIHVFGGGAVGGTFAALLAHAGYPVTVVDVDAYHVRAINRHGIAIKGALSLVQPISAVTTLAPDDRLRHVIVAVKAQATHEALAAISGSLAENATVALLQNGLGIYDARDLAPTGAVLGCTTSLGAYREAPGCIVFSGFGLLHVGALGGADLCPSARRLAAALARCYPAVDLSTDIEGHIWGKLALAAVYALSALEDVDFVDLLNAQSFLDEASELVAEVVCAAHAFGVNPFPVDGWDASEVAMGDRAVQTSSWQALRTAWVQHSQRRTGIWIDLVIKRRTTEVPALFRPVIGRGGSTPHLAQLLARYACAEENLLLPTIARAPSLKPTKTPPNH